MRERETERKLQNRKRESKVKDKQNTQIIRFFPKKNRKRENAKQKESERNCKGLFKDRTDRQRYTQTDRQRYMQTDRQRYIQTDRQTEKRYIQTDKQADKHACKVGAANRERDTE